MVESTDQVRARVPRGGVIAFGVALLGALALCAAAPLLPAHDGPQHLLMGHIEGHFADPAQHYERYFVRAPQFAGKGFALWFVPLELALGARRAAFVTPALVLALTSLCSALFVWLVAPRRGWLAVLCVPLAFSWAFYMGFYPFSLATGGALVALGALVRALEGGALHAGGRGYYLRTAGFALAFVALSVMHSVAALMGAAAFGAVALLAGAGTGPVRWGPARRALWAFVVGSPALAVTLLTARAQVQRPTALSTAVVWQGDAVRRLATIGALFAPGPRARGALVLAAAVAAGLYAVARREKSRPVERALGAAAFAFAAAAWAMPTHVPSWDFVSPRFVPFAVLFGLALVPVERLRAGPALCVLAACALAWWPVRFQFSARARLADAWSAVGRGAVRSGPRLLVMYAPFAGFAADPWEREVIEWHPLRTLGLLYCSVEGGVNSVMFRGHPGAHAQLDAPGAAALWPPAANLRSLPANPAVRQSPAGRDAVADLYAASGERFTDVLLLGNEQARARFALRGYAREFHSGRLSIERFVGCRARVLVTGPGVARVDALQLGVTALSDEARAVSLGPAGPDGARVAELERAPCGPVWLRAVGEARCEGADAAGRVAREVTAGAELRCVLGAL